MGSGNILLDGVNTFSWVFTRLWEITKELVPYFIEISIIALWITLLWKALKRIVKTAKWYTMWTFYDRRARNSYWYRWKEKRTKRDEKELEDAIKYNW